MADWQRRVRMNPEWDMAKDGHLSAAQLAQAIVRKLRAVHSRMAAGDLADKLADVIAEFEMLEGDEGAGMDDIDEAMDRLYDWGDTSLDGKWNGKKVCWIDTISA